MTIELTQRADLGWVEIIRARNDQFRTTLVGGAVLMTAGIVALGEDAQARVLAAVRAFQDFTDDNDPWGEHDFGALDIDLGTSGQPTTREKVFFKIDYFDLTRARHSSDPADPAKTERVMTIMLATEY